MLLAPAAALVAAFFGGEPLLADWTQVFMGSAARLLAQFFSLFLLGAVFGKLMEDSGAVSAVADFMTKRLGERRVMLAVVLAGAFVTYGGVSLFVAFFVLAPMAQTLFRAAAIPRRLMPAAIVLGTPTFTMSALPGTPSIQNAIPMPFFGTTPFAAPGLGMRRSLCSASACGGWDEPRPGLATWARVMGQTYRSLPMPPRTMRSCASVPPRLASWTQPRFVTESADVVMVGIVGAIIALIAVIVLGTAFGSF